ncbi:hypothetical protein [Pseudomonas vanderleydeniana]|uniref:Uncharacterized protein n=1 Tax=Pseudomonas vanderleydeniana TaxID=2745495 RepID=A0A9E6TPM5_9PSED|nr:hypothetical protein [Pseudomonas vanderleydeniana]QXI25646.1 hypothetical protein HU752_016840 [Pseudomonas vanderleydeniana]
MMSYTTSWDTISLVVSENHGEWDCFCAGDFGETKRTLAVGKPGTDGFASLRVTEVSTGSRSVLKGDEECEDIPSDSKTTVFSLAYAGSRYEAPKARRGLDHGMDGG